MSQNSSKFFLAGIIGAMAGAIGGLLLAPKSGKETRQDIVNMTAKISENIKTEVDETKMRVKDVYGKATDETMQRYNEIKDSVVTKVAAIKTAGEEINKEKYSKIVDGVVEDFKTDLSSTKTGAEKISNYMKKDWEKIKKAIA